MAINQKRPDTPLAATPEPRFMAVNDSIKPKPKAYAEMSVSERKEARRISDSIKQVKLRPILEKSYQANKKPGQTFEQWDAAEKQRTKENSYKAKEPKGERTFFAGDNGPKSPCKGGACMKSN
jgi:hypothetical protein